MDSGARIRALLVLGLALCASSARADFFSPGDLSRPHAAFEGVKNCTRCHEAGQKLSPAKCLACHTELASSIRDGRGLHGRIPANERACESCHEEHRGRDFNLVDWGPKKQKGFEHTTRTGFALEGEHARLGCEKCHEPRLIIDETVQALLKKYPAQKTFLGLPTACGKCHFDEHRGQLGARCEQCHTAQAWKPASGFDHSRADFALAGAHRKVGCEKCHPTAQAAPTPAGTFPSPRAATFTRYKELPHARCQDCHQDPHQGRLGDRCENCHTVDSWLQVTHAQEERAFHDKTRFPLRGLHAAVPCKSCHGPFPGRPAKFQGMAFGACTDCHADAHLGQLEPVGGKPPGCEQCHTEEGFNPARFGLEEHAKTRYPLEGSHRAVACAGCHREEPSLAQKISPAVSRELASRKRRALFSFMVFDFPAPPGRCETCHTDPHGGQFSDREGCNTCHGVESFHTLNFQHDRDTRFPLTGKHSSAACASCHPTVREDGRELTRYKPLETSCASCHEDVHAGQFAPAPGQPTDCARCHETSGFKPTKFTHTPPFTDFLLAGLHTSVPCEKCHVLVPVGEGLQVRKYQGTPRTCRGCHADPHHGAFQEFKLVDVPRVPARLAPLKKALPEPKEPECESCHKPTGWKEASFPHERTGFPLLGAHAKAGCKACHGQDLSQPLARECASCHRDAHAGELGQRCEGCHDSNGWTALFSADAHRRTNFPLSGRHALLPCQECHVDMRGPQFGRKTVECIACHQRDYDRTSLGRLDHLALGLSTDCRQCHEPWSFEHARLPGHDKCFQITIGPHAGISCLDCHSSLTNLAPSGMCDTQTAACTNCHRHQCANSDRRHRNVPGYECADQKCYECHRFSTQK